MKTNVLALVLIVATSLTNFVIAQHAADESSIQAILQEEVTSWNKGDAAGYSNHFAQDGTFTNILGQFFIGHKFFMERHEAIFKTVFKGTSLHLEAVSLKFIKPDVAIVETLSWVSGFSGEPPPGAKLDAKGRLVTRLLQVMTKDGADWKIVAYHNIDVKPGIPVPEPK